MSAGQWAESACRAVVTVGVVAVGMAAGFVHTHAAAVRAGQTGWLAWADAVVVELLVVVAGWQLHYRRRVGGSLRFPGVVMVAAFTVQMGSQVSGAPATPAGWLFAALPALGALLIIKMSMGSRPEAPPAESSPLGDALVQAEAFRQVEQEPAPEITQAATVLPMQRASWPPN